MNQYGQRELASDGGGRRNGADTVVIRRPASINDIIEIAEYNPRAPIRDVLYDLLENELLEILRLYQLPYDQDHLLSAQQATERIGGTPQSLSGSVIGIVLDNFASAAESKIKNTLPDSYTMQVTRLEFIKEIYQIFLDLLSEVVKGKASVLLQLLYKTDFIPGVHKNPKNPDNITKVKLWFDILILMHVLITYATRQKIQVGAFPTYLLSQRWQKQLSDAHNQHSQLALVKDLTELGKYRV